MAMPVVACLWAMPVVACLYGGALDQSTVYPLPLGEGKGEGRAVSVQELADFGFEVGLGDFVLLAAGEVF